MTPRLVLNAKEATLRSLLLDVGEYIGETEHVPKPQLRFTGGWVRDKLLGVHSKDIDVAIDNMTGEKFGLAMKRFLEDHTRSAKYGEDVVHRISKIEANPDKSKHLETATTTVFGLDIDLVNLRKETYTQDSRNPQIEPATPEEDALRRDSTVNALFYNLQNEEVEDFTRRGLDDLKEGVIRTPLEPFQTFADDPLRVLRCIRFASRLGYKIDPKALQFMGDKRITDALQIKISRERIGVEIEKMLTGPGPKMALELIDQQGLYEAVFSNPLNPEIEPEGTAVFKQAYNFLLDILNDSDSTLMVELRSMLISSEDDKHYAWVLCSLIPWERQMWPTALKLTSRSKRVFPAAAVVAREGLKIENKMLEVIINAIDHFEDVEDITTHYESMPPDSQSDADLQERFGMAIRRWGPHWRSTVLFALLLHISHGQQAQCQKYLAWLSKVQSMNLFEAFTLRPLINGSELMKALNRPGGPWLSEALESVVRWQFRNPTSTDKEAAIGMVREGLQQQ